MNRALISKEVRDLRWKLLVGFLVLLGAVLLMIVLYEKLLEVIPQDTGQLPPFISVEMLQGFSDYTTAMWSNFNDKNLPQIGTLLAIVLGIGLLAPEIESGTITLLLTNGACRRRVFWIKASLAIVALILLPMVISLLIPPFSRVFGYSLSHLRLVPATLVACLGLSFVLAVSLFISLLVKDRIWSGIASAILFGLWSVLGFWKSTRVLSPFYHMRAADYFFGETKFPWLTALGFLIATAVVLLAAERRFMNEEL